MLTVEPESIKTFQNGSDYLRADFHLHTRKDSEFSYTGADDWFASHYVEALKKAGIRIGVITNHNKFHLEEFKELRKNALKDEIFLLPGVELSVKDGLNGLHTLVVFHDDWIDNRENNDYINDFINLTFAGQSNYNNARSNHDLLETIRELDKFGKDYFLIFAHVEENNGLWGGLSGGRIRDLGQDRLFKIRTLGFQKVSTSDKRERVQEWLGNWYPAEVEGSDCKSIEEIGKGSPCYLKIGAFTFEAVKYALRDYPNRVSKEPVKYKHSYLKSISFEGGVLDGKTIALSPELNSLIGIHGTGKSSVLEAIRYVLDIPFGNKVADQEYKNRLVQHTLGSGGKAVIKAIDRRGQEYEIRRILNEPPDVYVNNILQPGISIRETIVQKPIYFGQKDLSRTGEGFEKDLVEKLVGEKLKSIRCEIEDQRQKVTDVIIRLNKLSNVAETKKEYEDKKSDAEHRLKFYKKHGIEEKLQKRLDFEADARKCGQITDSVKNYLDDLEDFIAQYEDDLKNNRLYKSKQNADFFTQFFQEYDQVITAFNLLKKALSDGKDALSKLNSRKNDFIILKESLKEEFAEIERKLSEDLRNREAQAINISDDFLQLKKTVSLAGQMLNALEKEQTRQVALKHELKIELSKLNELWLKEFKAIQQELGKVNKNHSSLNIDVKYKEDKDAFLDYMKLMFRGSKIREHTLKKLTDEFLDFGVLFRSPDKVKTIIGNSASIFDEYFNKNLSDFLTWQVPNKFIIKYRGKELKQHSLGQRASALILFVLSQRENDLIIIDQPEDDLDNQTIYEDVIKLIRQLKKSTQFIFATHNPNLLVLGDSERILACSYADKDEKISLTKGNVDCPELQQKIVDIMEGGKEAFDKRKEIYLSWKPQNS